MKAVSFLLIGLLFSSASFSQDAKLDSNLLWSDEFDQDGLPSALKWSFEVGDHGWGNNELQFSKGKGAWQYGYVEVRAKLPQGRGTWPAIWMLPEESRFGGWPKDGEIDIMEHVGYDPGKVHGTVHTEAFNHLQGTQKGGQLLVPNFASEFHTYAVDWKQGQMDFFIDGKHYFTFKNTGNGYQEWPFDQPFYLILNLAVGGNWGGKEGVDASIWPQRMEVDYVRVYKQNPQLNP